MSEPAHIGKQRIHAFLSTDDISLAGTSLTLFVNVPGVKLVGNRQEAQGAFAQIGKAVAKAAGGRLGLLDGGASDAILAEYVPSSGKYAGSDKVHVLRSRAGERDPNFEPWTVGRDIRVVVPDPTKPAIGVVVRGSMPGDRGFDQHVFIGFNEKDGKPLTIILHHEAPDAPKSSTLAYEGDGTRPAMLSDALRIGAGVDALCQLPPQIGKTVAKPNEAAGPDWVYLNATDHGGPRFSGYLASRFAERDALLSFEAGGPLRHAPDNHSYALTRDKRYLGRGALSIAMALWSNGNPDFTAPLGIEEVDEPPVQMPEGHPVRCPIQFDPQDFHPHLCAPGKLPKVVKVHTRFPVAELPKCHGTQTANQVPPATDVRVYTGGMMMIAGLSVLSHPDA